MANILSPKDDEEFQTVLDTLQELPVVDNYTQAIQAATKHVLDGPKTGRFDLNSPEIDSGERRAVGAKLEYELLQAFHWKKEKPLDVKISGVPVDIKATVGDNWSIPKEANCRFACAQRSTQNLTGTRLGWSAPTGHGSTEEKVTMTENEGLPLTPSTT